MAKPKSLVDLLAEAKPAPRGGCKTCRDYPHLLDQIREGFQFLLSGKAPSRELTLLYRVLRDNYEYRIGDTGLRKHLERCEPELWGAWKNAHDRQH